MGWLDKLLGRSKEVASDVADTAGDAVDKGVDVAGDAIDKGQELAGDAVDKGKDLLDGDEEPPAGAPPA
jgi:hypothetical protein